MTRKKNEKLWNHLIKEIQDFEIQGGWFENTRYDDGTPVGYIAAIQNYGALIPVNERFKKYLHYIGVHIKNDTKTFQIPARPFMEHAKERVEGQEGQDILTQELLRVFNGKQTMKQAIYRLGLWLEKIIKEEVIKTNSPKLNPMTITMRENAYDTKSKSRSSKPLNGTGHMLNSVQSKSILKGK